MISNDRDKISSFIVAEVKHSDHNVWHGRERGRGRRQHLL